MRREGVWGLRGEERSAERGRNVDRRAERHVGPDTATTARENRTVVEDGTDAEVTQALYSGGNGALDGGKGALGAWHGEREEVRG